MSIDPRRRDAITVAVAAHDRAAEGPLPLNAARLLATMFPSADVCQRSLLSLEEEGFDRRKLPATFQRLIRAGLLSREPGSGPSPDTYRLHLPPARR
jgi:hypothetical protein